MHSGKSAAIELKPVSMQIVEVLRQWIVSGRLAAGESVRQEALAKELGVSRVPVREALVALETEGLIVREQYKGAFVAEISMDEVRETYALRELLELYLFENSLPNITEENLLKAESIIKQSSDTAMGRDWARLNLAFHMTLYKPAGMPLTMQTLKNVLRRTDRYFRLQQAVVPTVRQESHDQHQQILDTIRTGDNKASIHAMREHIRANADEVITYLVEHLGTTSGTENQ